MREIKNAELREIEEKMRSEEIQMCDSSLHAEYIISVCEELDTHFTAFKKRRIYEISNENNLNNDADIIIQEEFENKILEDKNENLQDLVSDFMYSLLQDIRNIASDFQKKLILKKYYCEDCEKNLSEQNVIDKEFDRSAYPDAKERVYKYKSCPECGSEVELI